MPETLLMQNLVDVAALNNETNRFNINASKKSKALSTNNSFTIFFPQTVRDEPALS